MVLVNGTDGIGTGWSSYIPNFNPSDIVANLRRKLAGEEMEPMHPWYRGFRVRWLFFLWLSPASRADRQLQPRRARSKRRTRRATSARV